MQDKMTLMRLICALLLLAAANTFGAADRTTQVNAVLLDQNDFPCDNCLFGMNDYYFCFQAGDKILVGHDKVRTQMRHKSPVGLMEVGKPVPLRFDDTFIWVSPPGSKEIRLKQDYTTRIFLNNKSCKAATK